MNLWGFFFRSMDIRESHYVFIPQTSLYRVLFCGRSLYGRNVGFSVTSVNELGNCTRKVVGMGKRNSTKYEYIIVYLTNKCR
jgi:hypothetical protein